MLTGVVLNHGESKEELNQSTLYWGSKQKARRCIKYIVVKDQLISIFSIYRNIIDNVMTIVLIYKNKDDNIQK